MAATEFSTADWLLLLQPATARWRTSATLQWCANQRPPAADAERCPVGAVCAARTLDDR
jgi:hypothetical protein